MTDSPVIVESCQDPYIYVYSVYGVYLYDIGIHRIHVQFIRYN